MRPTRLTLRQCAYALDGGTICLLATDGGGREHTIVLTQHAFPRTDPSTGHLPGRLYFDGELVPLRSEFESNVVSLLRAAEIWYDGNPARGGEPIELSPNALVLGDDIREVLTQGPEDNIRTLASRVVRFVESEECLWFADRVEQAVDESRYEVSVVWNRDNFYRAIVAVKQLLDIPMSRAREIVQQDLPVARGSAAAEVVEWAGRFRAAGLDVRVSPEFRWRLP